jgi:16S rRNA (guanine527-N7)-methyltransferase
MDLIVNKTLTPPIVSRETMEKFKAYFEILMTWNKTISLMETMSWEEFYKRHFLDAIQISSLIKEDIFDLGSGAGIPGIPLLMMGHHVVLIESNMKKSKFLNYCLKRFALENGSVSNHRIESIEFPMKSLFVARALSPLKNLLKYLSNVSRETKGIFLKGQQLYQEIEDAKKEWLFDYELYRSISDETGIIIYVFDIRKR